MGCNFKKRQTSGYFTRYRTPVACGFVCTRSMDKHIFNTASVTQFQMLNLKCIICATCAFGIGIHNSSRGTRAEAEGQIETELRNILKKNKIDQYVAIKWINEDDLPNLDPSDAIVNFVNGSPVLVEGRATITRSTGVVNPSRERTFVNIGSQTFRNRTNENSRMYAIAYVASHEILHQYLVKAELFHFGRADLPHHDDDKPNLNRDAKKLLFQ